MFSVTRSHSWLTCENETERGLFLCMSSDLHGELFHIRVRRPRLLENNLRRILRGKTVLIRLVAPGLSPLKQVLRLQKNRMEQKRTRRAAWTLSCSSVQMTLGRGCVAQQMSVNKCVFAGRPGFGSVAVCSL